MTTTREIREPRVRYVCCAPCWKSPEGRRCRELDDKEGTGAAIPDPPMHAACCCYLVRVPSTKAEVLAALRWKQ